MDHNLDDDDWMGSKVNMIGLGKATYSYKPKLQLQLKSKPSPVSFNNKSGPPPKKIKFSNGQEPTKTTYNSNNINSEKNKISIQEHKRRLPIFEQRNKLLEIIKRHSTLIIIGETGCGKTTQIPQYIYSARLQESGKIGITQPRRVAAVSIAMRVAQEFGVGSVVGETVGYSVRFEDVTSNRTKIKYLTDGMLLREAMVDRLLTDYTVIILDEAHERTIHTDVLFGIVKAAQKARHDGSMTPLKVIIMSATMDVDHFSHYFNKCQAVYIEGRTYPVNIFYAVKSQDDYQSACVATFFKIHREAPANHGVLIFLTGQEEIEVVAHQIRTLARDPEVDGVAVRVLSLYGAQAGATQMQVFQPVPPNVRKVVVSTNIAETSVTIRGIRYVIDCGMVKARTYHPATGLDMLKVQRISQEQSWQRAGRAGRDSEGFCYRVYTSIEFELMQKSTVPEIQRANLNTVVLQLLALDVDALTFDFMDKPPKESIVAACEQLKLLGAIESVESKVLSRLGKKMARFPLDPRFGKILLSAETYGCLDEVLTIVALMSSESVLLNPVSKREYVEAARDRFLSVSGDHVTLLNIYKEFSKVGQKNRRSWCHEHYINTRNINYAREIKNQLKDICQKSGLTVESCGDQTDPILKCLLTGLFMNVAELRKDKKYITLDKRQVVSVHPSSVLHNRLPPCAIYTEVVQTNKCYVRNVSRIEEEWLMQIVPDYRRSHNVRYAKD